MLNIDDKNVAHNNFTLTTNLNPSTANNHTSISPSSNVNIIIVVVSVACCVVLVAVVSILSLVYLRKKNPNTECSSTNISQQHIVMTDIQVEDEVYHEYATIDDNDIVQIEVNRKRVANTPKSNTEISEDKNGTKNVERAKNTGRTGDYTDDIRWYEQLSGKKCERGTHAYEGTLVGSAGGELSMSSTKEVNLNRLSDDIPKVSQHNGNDTSESEYVEDVKASKHLTKTQERDIYAFEGLPPLTAGQEQKGLTIVTSGEMSASLDVLKRRAEDEADRACSSSDNYTEDVVWTDPPIQTPTECEVKDYEFEPECTDEQANYLSPTY